MSITPEQEIAELIEELAVTATERDQWKWCYEELAFKLRDAAAKALMKRPEFREQLERQLAGRMGQPKP